MSHYNYTSKTELQHLLQEFQQTDRMPSKLVKVCENMVWGLTRRFRFATYDIDETVQNMVLLLLQKKNNIKPEGNVFGYLSQCCMNLLRKRARDSSAYKR